MTEPTSKAWALAALEKPTGYRLTVMSGRPPSRAAWSATFPDAATATAARRLAVLRLGSGLGVIPAPGKEVVAACEEAARVIRATIGMEFRPWAESFGALIGAWKLPHNVVALAAGVDGGTVTRWVAGERQPSWLHVARLRAFARAAGLPWDDDAILSPTPRRGARARVKFG